MNVMLIELVESPTFLVQMSGGGGGGGGMRAGDRHLKFFLGPCERSIQQ